MMGFNWLDWLMAFILLWGSIRGLARGFMLALFGIASYVLALAAAIVFTSRVTALVNNVWHLEASVAAFLNRTIRLPRTISAVDLATVPLNEVTARVRELALPAAYKDALMEKITRALALAAGPGDLTLGSFLYEAMAEIIVSTLVFVVLFSLTRGTIILIGRMAHNLMRPGILSWVNRLAGLTLGLVQGGLFLAVLLGIITPLLSLPALGFLADTIEASRLAGFFIDGFYLLNPWWAGPTGLGFR